jgi:hypothetical protein
MKLGTTAPAKVALGGPLASAFRTQNPASLNQFWLSTPEEAALAVPSSRIARGTIQLPPLQGERSVAKIDDTWPAIQLLLRISGIAEPNVESGPLILNRVNVNESPRYFAISFNYLFAFPGESFDTCFYKHARFGRTVIAIRFELSISRIEIMIALAGHKNSLEFCGMCQITT